MKIYKAAHRAIRPSDIAALVFVYFQVEDTAEKRSFDLARKSANVTATPHTSEPNLRHVLDDILVETFCPPIYQYAERELLAAWGDGWLEGLQTALGRDIVDVEDGRVLWEPSLLFSVLIGLNDRVFSAPPARRSMVFAIRDARNRWAHPSRPLTFDDVVRWIDVMEQFVVAISPRTAEELKQMRYALMENRFNAPLRAEVQRQGELLNELAMAVEERPTTRPDNGSDRSSSDDQRLEEIAGALHITNRLVKQLDERNTAHVDRLDRIEQELADTRIVSEELGAQIRAELEHIRRDISDHSPTSSRLAPTENNVASNVAPSEVIQDGLGIPAAQVPSPHFVKVPMGDGSYLVLLREVDALFSPLGRDANAAPVPAQPMESADEARVRAASWQLDPLKGDTDRERARVLNGFLAYHRTHGRPPTLRDIETAAEDVLPPLPAIHGAYKDWNAAIASYGGLLRAMPPADLPGDW